MVDEQTTLTGASIYRFDLSDLEEEEVLIDTGYERAPDNFITLQICHLLEHRDLGCQIFEQMAAYLHAQGVPLRTTTIEDAMSTAAQCLSSWSGFSQGCTSI